jgi:hypothetical protein
LFESHRTPTDVSGAVAGIAGVEVAAAIGTLDTSTLANDHGLDYANHVNVTNPMTDARLDLLFAEGSLRLGRADFATDTACCTTVSRASTARTFGTPTDGLDAIDNSTELNAVLNNSVARVKVVRAINYCGSTGTNIIGCAWVGGKGMALVRMSTSIAKLSCGSIMSTDTTSAPSHNAPASTTSCRSTTHQSRRHADRGNYPPVRRRAPTSSNRNAPTDGDSADGIDNQRGQHDADGHRRRRRVTPAIRKPPDEHANGHGHPNADLTPRRRDVTQTLPTRRRRPPRRNPTRRQQRSPPTLRAPTRRIATITATNWPSQPTRRPPPTHNATKHRAHQHADGELDTDAPAGAAVVGGRDTDHLGSARPEQGTDSGCGSAARAPHPAHLAVRFEQCGGAGVLRQRGHL